MSKKMTTICDKCALEIAHDFVYVNVGTYGAKFCLYCFWNMTTSELLIKLNLGNIKVMRY